MKKLWLEKKGLVVKVIAGVLVVAMAGTGIGFSAVQAKSKENKENNETVVASESTDAEDTDDQEEDEDDLDDQADLLTNIIKSQVGSESSEVGKEETVYVVSDANGEANQVIVSDWLKNDKAEDTIKDASDLKDIKNVKGDEGFKEGKDGELTWDAEGSDIYYQGTTDKELPVNVKITYFLDGKEMSAKDIAGKSGKVTIRFDYENSEKQTVKIGNKDEEVYVPFTVMSSMILPTEHFKDIKVTNGKVMSEGLNNIVMGLAFPGLKDSLQLDEKKLEDKDIEIPDYVEVSAVTDDFELDMTLSVVLSDALTDIHLTDSIDLSEIDDKMDDLTDASTQLKDGTQKLKDGVDTLDEKTGEFKDGAKKLDEGVAAYTDGVGQLSNGINTLKDGTSQLKSGAGDLASGAGQVAAGAKQVSDGVNQAVGSVSELATTLGNTGTDLAQKAATYKAAADKGENELNKGQNDINKGIDELAGASTSLGNAVVAAMTGVLSQNPNASGQEVVAAVQAVLQQASGSGSSDRIDELKAGVTYLRAGAEQQGEGYGAATALNTVATKLSGMDTSELAKLGDLQKGASDLAKGASDLSNGANQLKSGIDKLDDGAAQLQNGANTLASKSGELKDGSSKIYDATGKLADGVGELKTGATDLNDGMVKFDKEGIEKLTDAFQGEGKNALDRLNATMDAAHDYHTFTKLADGVDGSVKFIIRTEAVKADK